MNALAAAIYSRSQVASDYKTSIGGRQYFVKNDADPIIYPFVVLMPLSEMAEYYFDSKNTSTSNFEEVECSFNIHSNNQSSSEAGTILGYLKTHYDDINLSVSGWDSVVMERQGVVGPLWNEETTEWIYSVEYKIILQKQ